MDDKEAEERLVRKLLSRAKPFRTQSSRWIKSDEEADLIRRSILDSPYLSGLDADQVEKFIKVAKLQTFPKGEFILKEGYVDGREETESPLFSVVSSSPPPEPTEEAATNDDHVDMDDEALLDDEEDGLYSPIDANVDNEKSRREEKPEQNQVSLDPTAADDFGGIDTNTWDLNSPTQDRDSRRLSGVDPSIYIVRSGAAEKLQGEERIEKIGPNEVFGEVSFFFLCQHPASVVVASGEELECWVVDEKAFMNYVLPTRSMVKTFVRHASNLDEKGEPYMTMDDFIRWGVDRVGEEDADRWASTKFGRLFRTDSSPNQTRISLQLFCLFRLIMTQDNPDAVIAFRLMDQSRQGVISRSDLEQFIPGTDIAKSGLLDFAARHFGRNEKLVVQHQTFSEFLHELEFEMGTQAFLQLAGKSGTLTPPQLVKALTTSFARTLPTGMTERLGALVPEAFGANVRPQHPMTKVDRISRRSFLGGNGEKITYPDYVAHQNVLLHSDLIANLINRACTIKGGPISSEELMLANRVLGESYRLSKRQLEIVFALFDSDGDGRVSSEDCQNLLGSSLDMSDLVLSRDENGSLIASKRPEKVGVIPSSPSSPPPSEDSLGARSVQLGLDDVGRGFAVGTTAGFGGSLLGLLFFPLDTLKTRLQLHDMGVGRSASQGFGGISQVIRSEGLGALFRGLGLYFFGSASQRVVQLAVRDLVWGAIDVNEHSNSNLLSYSMQSLSGACAGACQVLLANPVELGKIRKQTNISPLRTSAGSRTGIGSNLRSVYHGAGSCLVRDVPFSTIFFPLYSVCKEFISDWNVPPEIKTNEHFLAATVAAGTAGLVTTPADVVKTRLQSTPRPGGVIYSGIFDCASKILKQEGFSVFFRGASLRAMVIAPNYGVAMALYENPPLFKPV